jgi:two-component system, chemotaxis family, protein-glutamate methylesterase/glutaminase
MQSRTLPEVVLMAGSLGGIEALKTVLSGLPQTFPVPIIIVQHRTTAHPNLLARVLSRVTKLTIEPVLPNQELVPGTVYLAPPDRHVTVTATQRLALSDGQRIKHVLSAADPLFVSAAQNFGSRVIAVVLTGNDSDAAAGARAVKDAGGVVLAQDAASSKSFQMPHAAIATGAVDEILPLDRIAPALVRLTSVPSGAS